MRALDVTSGSNAAPALSRRRMLAHCSSGFGLAALSALLSDAAFGASPVETTASGAKPPHFAPKAKNVIFCYMSGGVSHVDSFDPKPRLERDHGKPMPMQIERTQFNNNGNIYRQPFEVSLLRPERPAGQRACSRTSAAAPMNWP